MTKRTTLATTLLLTTLASAAVLSGNALAATPYSAGIGITSNTAEESDSYKVASGYQIFAGYDFNYKIANMVGVKAELGFSDSGDYDGKPQISGGTVVTPETYNSTGGWLAAVFDYNLFGSSFDFLLRAGFDFGDEDGGLIGGGFNYNYDPKIDLRLEYVIRDESESGQINVSYQF